MVALVSAFEQVRELVILLHDAVLSFSRDLFQICYVVVLHIVSSIFMPTPC